ncbi:MAG: molybdopterin cofactor-binding domain-containing protein, partial [Rudaea sp.]
MSRRSTRTAKRTNASERQAGPEKAVSAERREQNPSGWRSSFSPPRAKQLDDWLQVAPDGNIVVFSGKVELGTGVRTALAQIVAEELDVPLDRIRMVMGDTAVTPNEGYTAGSMTIQVGGVALREAAAEARQAMLKMAGDRLDAALDELVVEEGVVSVRGRPERRISYSELMSGKRFNREVTGKAPKKRPAEYHLVGRPLPRLDIPAKLTGEPSFVQDLRLPGMLHGRVIRPPGPGARLVSVNPESVKDIPGFVQVVHLNNFLGVVAEREEESRLAAARLEVVWQQDPVLPPMTRLYDFMREQETTDQVVHGEGNVERALKDAFTRLHAVYFQPYQNHASIGPSCSVADYKPEIVRVWASTQGVYPLRKALADLLELPEEHLQVIHIEGPGVYGHNGSDDAAADAVLLSRAVGRPVRVQWTREEEFAWEPKAPAMVMEVSGGLDSAGNIAAWQYDVWSPPHSTRPQSGDDFVAGQAITGRPAATRGWYGGGDRNAPTNYRIHDQRVTIHWLPRSPLRASSMRSLGGTANTFASESFMDELAAAAHR